MALVTGDDLATALGYPTPNVDPSIDACATAAEEVLTPLLASPTPENDATRHAALVIAVDVWQSRTAAGGQPVGLDFQPGPYQMGRSLTTRVAGLIAPYRDTGALAQ